MEEVVVERRGRWERRRDQLTVYTDSLQGQRGGTRRERERKEEEKERGTQEENLIKIKRKGKRKIHCF